MSQGKNKRKSTFDVVYDCQRRNDNRLSQVRYSAKRKLKFEALCRGIQDLKLEIQSMQNSIMDFYPIVQSAQMQAACVRLSVLQDLYKLFQGGVRGNNASTGSQVQFVHENLKPEIILNGNSVRRDIFWNQMVLLSALYPNFQVIKVDVCGLTHEIINVTGKVHFQLNRNVMRWLYPSLKHKLNMVDFLDGKWMTPDIHQIYYFEGPYIQSIDTHCDWLNAWRPLCRSYKDVRMILHNANINQHLFIHVHYAQSDNTLQPNT